MFLQDCLEGDLAGVKESLVLGVDVNFSDGKATGLMKAITAGKEEVIATLLAHPDIDINRAITKSGVTAMHVACAVDNVAAIKTLTKDTRLTTLNTRECYGYSPLMMAVFTGKLSATKQMIEVEGVDMSTKDNQGKGLHEVARERHPLLIKVLDNKKPKSKPAENVVSKPDERDLDEMLKFIESGDSKSKPGKAGGDASDAKPKKVKHQIKKKTPKDIVSYKKK